MNMKLTTLTKSAVAAACVGVLSFALPSFANDDESAPAAVARTAERARQQIESPRHFEEKTAHDPKPPV